MNLIVIENHPIKVLNFVKVDNKNLISIGGKRPNKTMKRFHHKNLNFQEVGLNSEKKLTKC